MLMNNGVKEKCENSLRGLHGPCKPRRPFETVRKNDNYLSFSHPHLHKSIFLKNELC